MIIDIIYCAVVCLFVRLSFCLAACKPAGLPVCFICQIVCLLACVFGLVWFGLFGLFGLCACLFTWLFSRSLARSLACLLASSVDYVWFMGVSCFHRFVHLVLPKCLVARPFCLFVSSLCFAVCLFVWAGARRHMCSCLHPWGETLACRKWGREQSTLVDVPTPKWARRPGSSSSLSNSLAARHEQRSQLFSLYPLIFSLAKAKQTESERVSIFWQPGLAMVGKGKPASETMAVDIRPEYQTLLTHGLPAHKGRQWPVDLKCVEHVRSKAEGIYPWPWWAPEAVLMPGVHAWRHI